MELKYQNRIKLVLIIILFCILLSWSFSNYIINERYSQSNDINKDLEKLKTKVYYNISLVEDIDAIEKKVSFRNSFCYEDMNDS